MDRNGYDSQHDSLAQENIPAAKSETAIPSVKNMKRESTTAVAMQIITGQPIVRPNLGYSTIVPAVPLQSPGGNVAGSSFILPPAARDIGWRSSWPT